MEIKRVNSLMVDGIQPNVNQSQTVLDKQNGRSQNGLSLVLGTRARVPQIMHQTLRQSKLHQGSAKQTNETDIKKSKLGSMIRSKIKDIQNIIHCQICDNQMKKSEDQVYMCNCEHKFLFCESCLHHYVIYKVKTFQQVRCPRQQCSAIIDTTTDFFKHLPLDIQKNYRKFHQFQITANDPNVKLCPKQNCQGLIRTTLQNVMVCDKCESEFCAKCLLSRHEGDCDSHQVQFFQGNLHYRQCKKCKFVIQKNQGCNHMTCRCSYQFCYVCGADWNPIHYNNHDENGVPIAPEGVNPPPAYNNNNDACCDCSCCEQNCGSVLACIFKSPIKLVLFILFLVFMLMIFCFRDLLVILGMAIVSILAGLFGFSFQILSDLQGWVCIVGVIFFPIIMIIGVGVAFKEIFCDVVPELCSQYWNIFCDGSQGIFSI